MATQQVNINFPYYDVSAEAGDAHATVQVYAFVEGGDLDGLTADLIADAVRDFLVSRGIFNTVVLNRVETAVTSL